MKKLILKIGIKVVIIIAILVLADSVYIIEPEESALVSQFGRVVDVASEPGINLKIPSVQTVKKVYTGEQLYDIAQSDVITKDKKTMIADCYSIWSISDVLKYHQTLSSATAAESKIDVAVYNAMKKHISSINQENVIKGKDGTLDKEIMSKIDDMDQYGINISDVEMKSLDLPSANKDAVYKRMISERNAIAAEYTALGEQTANDIRSGADKETRITISNAQTEAALTVAAGETEYFSILADAYNKDEGAREFYQFIIGLNSLKESLVNGGTIVIDAESPLYEIISNPSLGN